jgi:hypothetical protein
MATNSLAPSGDRAELNARRSLWASLAATAAATDARSGAHMIKADLSGAARIWRARIAAGSFGNSWSLLRSTK